MFNKNSIKSIGLIVVLGVFANFSTAANAQSLNRTYSVTVTNLTKSNAFTPLLGVTHSSAIALFEGGQEASPELADMAESGNIAPLTAVLDGLSAVGATGATVGLLSAGDSVTFEVQGSNRLSSFSVVAMILPTNDSFVALNGVELPKSRNKTVTYHAKAYDAGSETNTEICSDIPGPMCGGAGLSPSDSGEGFVHIANGIHGVGDLSPSMYTWDGTVAEIQITRVR